MIPEPLLGDVALPDGDLYPSPAALHPASGSGRSEGGSGAIDAAFSSLPVPDEPVDTPNPDPIEVLLDTLALPGPVRATPTEIRSPLPALGTPETHLVAAGVRCS